MADATQTVIEAAAAGLGAATLAIIGVEPQALLWGAVGAFMGMTFAAPAGRMRAALTFLAVVLACAELGTWAALKWFDALPVARNGSALTLGVLFHPLLAALVAKLPQIVGVATRTEKQ